jgi:type I restriction enzyme S subunit
VARVEAIAAKVEEAQRLRREAEEETDVAHRHAVDTLLEDERWPRRTLRSILREPSRNGLSARPSAAPPGYPILRISAATSRSDARVDESDVRYLEIDEREAAKYLLSKGDLLACRFNGNLRFVGRFALYCGESGQEQVYPDKLIRFRLDESIANPRFVTYAMNSDPGRRLIEALCATTAGNIGISAARLQEVTLPLPPLPDQVRIVSEIGRLEEALKRIRHTQQEASLELDALLPSVLDRAFRGEL